MYQGGNRTRSVRPGKNYLQLTTFWSNGKQLLFDASKFVINSPLLLGVWISGHTRSFLQKYGRLTGRLPKSSAPTTRPSLSAYNFCSYYLTKVELTSFQFLVSFMHLPPPSSLILFIWRSASGSLSSSLS